MKKHLISAKKEETLTREERKTLAQLRTNKSPILFQYKHKIDSKNYPSPFCPLCKRNGLQNIHDTTHLFQCPYIYVPPNKTPICLWNDLEYVTSLLRRWRACGGWPRGGAEWLLVSLAPDLIRERRKKKM